MGSSSSLPARMAEAARQLQEQDDAEGTMEEAVRLALSNVDGCDAAGLSMAHRRVRQVRTDAATHDMVRLGDRLQYEADEGPCLDAIWEEELVYSADLATDARWPTWGPRVAGRTEARSLMAFRLFTHEETLGALNLYSTRQNGFDAADRDDGLALAAQIAIAVAAAQEIEGLNVAVENRTLIGQAQGILMERFTIDADTAFRLLMRLSSTAEVKLRIIARDIVAGRHIPGLGADDGDDQHAS